MERFPFPKVGRFFHTHPTTACLPQTRARQDPISFCVWLQRDLAIIRAAAWASECACLTAQLVAHAQAPSNLMHTHTQIHAHTHTERKGGHDGLRGPDPVALAVSESPSCRPSFPFRSPSLLPSLTHIHTYARQGQATGRRRSRDRRPRGPSHAAATAAFCSCIAPSQDAGRQRRRRRRRRRR